jgi:hypothetical protein
MAWSVIFFWVILLIILAVVLVVFIQSPDEQKFKWFTAAHREGVEYAPEYSTQEKLIKLGLHALWLIPLYLVMKFSVFPVLSEPSTWLCQTWLGYPSATLMPVLLCIFSALLLIMGVLPVLWHWRKVLKLGQHPLPGQKVFKPTPVIKGPRARRRAWLALLGFSLGMLVFAVLLVLLAVRLGELMPAERINTICTQGQITNKQP